MKPTGTPVWIDLLDPTREQIAQVSQQCALQVPTREALQEIEASSRLRSDGHALYLSMPLAAHHESQSMQPVPLGFVLTPQLVVTVRFGEVTVLDQVKTRFAEQPPPDSATAFVTIIEALVDGGADMLEAFGGQLGQMSTEIFRQPELVHGRDKRYARGLRKRLSEVGALGDDLSQLRQTLLGLQRIVAFVGERAVGGFSDDATHRLRTAAADLVSLVEFEIHLTDKAQFLLDAILGYITTEQNDIFRVLTIVSIAGIPPTLIASLYGMNFELMPELHWRYGYPFALALILTSVLLPVLWFKRRGWW